MKLKAQEYALLCEALRRYLCFHKDENLLTAWTGLGFETAYRPVLDASLMAWVDDEVPSPHTMGWLRLTEKGAAIVSHWMENGYGKFVGHSPSNYFPPMNLLLTMGLQESEKRRASGASEEPSAERSGADGSSRAVPPPS